ncbi:putative NADH-flavin reductase [Lactobacillus colini]|uniref:NADH-flavin reductase n=1 Tax=Lactobacillus colini TaxID=1819254 RepID=A0ABS4MGA6_9LACO|nr:NAD(P)H-binding protein [Lactobacillus colini]MBP2058719.1 putative NADH-flavin reductase [Lactobacillus colini]
MRKIGIIGASGMAGSEIYKLASQQAEFEVTGIVRNKSKAESLLGSDASLLIGDILTMDDSLLEKFDVIVDAFATSPDKASEQISLAQKLVALAKRAKTRLIFILGAGSLHTGEDSHLVVEDIAKLDGSDAWINTPRQQLKELEYLSSVDDIDWLGISPSMEFEAGDATDYVIGKDELLFNDQHESIVTSGTMAKLVVSEILSPKHSKERITVVNK